MQGLEFVYLLPKAFILRSSPCVRGFVLMCESDARGLLPEWAEFICSADRGDARGFLRVGGRVPACGSSHARRFRKRKFLGCR